MKLLRKVGVTSEIWQIFIQDSSSTTGAGLTGLTNASGGLTAYYHRDTDTTATAISLVSMTVGTFTSSGFKEIDATNMPGWYQFCPPNAALASGAKSCAFHLKGATNMAPLPIEVDLQGDVNVTHWNDTAVASPATAGIPEVNVKNINNVATTSVTAVNANQGTTQPINFTGTGASALAKSDMVDIAGAAVSTSTAQIGVNVVNFGGSAGTFSSGKPAVTLASTDVTGNVAADVQTIKTQTVTCSAGVTVGAYVGNATAALAVSAAGGVTLANAAQGGSSCILTLQQLNLSNATGVALQVVGGSTTSGAISLSTIGASGPVIRVVGAGTNNDAIKLIATGTGVDLNLAGSGTIANAGGTAVVKPDLTQANYIETGFSALQTLQVIAAAVAGKETGAPGSPVFKGLDGTTTRITGTADSSGNRSAAAYNV